MAHGLEMAGSGQDHQASGAPAVAPRGDRGSTGEPSAGGVEMAVAGEPLNQELPQAPVAPVVEPGGEGGSREILSEEEEDSRRAPAPPTDGVPAHERQQTDVESDGTLSRSVNLRNVTSENNLVMILCASSHPKCAKWVYAALFLGRIVLAMSSRDTEVSAFSETERVHGCEHDRYCLSAESALHVSLAYFSFVFGVIVMAYSTLSTGEDHEWLQESETVEQIDRDVKPTHPEMQFFNAGSSDALANQESLNKVKSGYTIRARNE
ncbi:hypothetical protein ACQ4PT_020414 [Festuca glaucescens]